MFRRATSTDTLAHLRCRYGLLHCAWCSSRATFDYFRLEQPIDVFLLLLILAFQDKQPVNGVQRTLSSCRTCISFSDAGMLWRWNEPELSYHIIAREDDGYRKLRTDSRRKTRLEGLLLLPSSTHPDLPRAFICQRPMARSCRSHPWPGLHDDALALVQT